MVLESLLNPFSLKKKPWEMFFAGAFYSIIALFLSYIVVQKGSGLVMVFLIVIAALPILYTTVKKEEELDEKYKKEWKLLREHTKVIFFLILFFVGTAFALAIVYIVMPQEMAARSFDIQHTVMNGSSINLQGDFMAKLPWLGKILINNIRVLFFCFIFSFLYGTGALFILTWNASVVGVALGYMFKKQLAILTSIFGLHSFSSYFGAASISVLRYMTHGVMEMASYFIAGLAGGIISVAVIKHKWYNDRVIQDVILLVIISVILIIFSGLIEVYITPALIPSWS